MREQYRLANILYCNMQIIANNYKQNDSVDGGIVSFKVGMTKPDPKVYRCFLDKCGLEAESCVFIDDTEENVTAAKALGFAGIVFTSYEDLIDELKNILETKL